MYIYINCQFYNIMRTSSGMFRNISKSGPSKSDDFVAFTAIKWLSWDNMARPPCQAKLRRKSQGCAS